MTKKEGILLASRALTLYLLCWGLSDLTYLPQELLSARHHYAAHDYWLTYYVFELTFESSRSLPQPCGYIHVANKWNRSFFHAKQKQPNKADPHRTTMLT